MNVARRMRSKSPFRGRDVERRRSNSPFPRRRRSTGMGMGRLLGGNALHESEINVFQQLCLDRHDESAAIEILLQDGGPEAPNSKPTRRPSPPKDIPDLYTASSGSSDKTPAPTERKRSFLKRLFRSPTKAPDSSPTTSAPDTRVHILHKSHATNTESDSSEPSDNLDYLPRPPSTVLQTRTNQGLGPPVKQEARSVEGALLPDRFDTLSNLSSLSGTRASTVRSSRLKKPLMLDRHESLGMNSIRDVRKTLKEMERQLGKASNKGERVSRQKVMRALFTVADSLEDEEEREMIQRELEGVLRSHRHGKKQAVEKSPSSGPPRKKSLPKTPTSQGQSDEGGATTGYVDKKEKESAPFSLLSSVGKMFSVNAEEKKAVEAALDDLLWTEFVADRSTNEEGKKKRSGRGRTLAKKPSPSSQVTERPRHKISVVQQPRKDQDSSNLHPTQRPTQASRGGQSQPQRARSWWRRHPTNARARRSPSFSSSSSSSASSSSASWEEDDDDDESFDIEDDDFEEYEEEEEEESTSDDSAENMKYLPKSITVRHSPSENRNELELGGGKPKNARNDKTFALRNTTNMPRYRVRMVDTESRIGFETGSASMSSRK